MRIKLHRTFFLGCICFAIGFAVGAWYYSHGLDDEFDSAELIVKIKSMGEKSDSRWGFTVSFSTPNESVLFNPNVVLPQHLHVYTPDGVEVPQEETGVTINLPKYRLKDCKTITSSSGMEIDLSRPVVWDDSRNVWVLDLLIKSYSLMPERDYLVVMSYPGTALVKNKSELKLVQSDLATQAVSSPILLRIPPGPQ